MTQQKRQNTDRRREIEEKKHLEEIRGEETIDACLRF